MSSQDFPVECLPGVRSKREISAQHPIVASCECGKFEVSISEPPFGACYCYCNSCRRAAGAVAKARNKGGDDYAWTTPRPGGLFHVREHSVKVTKGLEDPSAPSIAHFEAKPGSQIHRYCCNHCYTRVFNWCESFGMIGVYFDTTTDFSADDKQKPFPAGYKSEHHKLDGNPSNGLHFDKLGLWHLQIGDVKKNLARTDASAAEKEKFFALPDKVPGKHQAPVIPFDSLAYPKVIIPAKIRYYLCPLAFGCRLRRNPLTFGELLDVDQENEVILKKKGD